MNVLNITIDPIDRNKMDQLTSTENHFPIGIFPLCRSRFATIPKISLLGLQRVLDHYRIRYSAHSTEEMGGNSYVACVPDTAYVRERECCYVTFSLQVVSAEIRKWQITYYGKDNAIIKSFNVEHMVLLTEKNTLEDIIKFVGVKHGIGK